MKAAKVQRIVAIAVLLPLLLIGIVPLLTGDIHSENFTPFVPLINVAGVATNGAWDMVGVTTLMACLLLAAWSTYPFETAVCYVSEFRILAMTRCARLSTPACCASPSSRWFP